MSCMVQATNLYKDICLCDPVHITNHFQFQFYLNNGFKIVCNSKSCWKLQIYQPTGYLLTGDSYSITKCTFHWNFLDHDYPCKKPSYWDRIIEKHSQVYSINKVIISNSQPQTELIITLTSQKTVSWMKSLHTSPKFNN